jgi:hypothetical protein
MLPFFLGIDCDLEHAKGEAEYVPFTKAGFLGEAGDKLIRIARHGEIPHDTCRCRPCERETAGRGGFVDSSHKIVFPRGWIVPNLKIISGRDGSRKRTLGAGEPDALF